MLGYYTHFSARFRASGKQLEWLEMLLNKMPDEFDGGGDTQTLEVRMAGELQNVLIDDYGMCGWEKREDEDGSYIWFYGDNEGHPDLVALIVHAFLKHFSIKKAWGFEWAYSCSKPKTDGFGGGVAFVTDEVLEIRDTRTWLEDSINEYKRREKSVR